MSTIKPNNFAGKVAYVTGGAAGIGRATAVAFAEAGANVTVADVNRASAEETAKQIEKLGRRALVVQADVSRDEDTSRAIDETIAIFGRLDYAFNNAGIEGRAGVTVVDLKVEEWDRIIGINLRGVFLGLKYQIPHMLKQGGGAIVNCASVAGIVGFQGIPAYTASKHGVVGLTKTTALDFATKNIRVNAIAPGVTDTPMVERCTGGTEEARKMFTGLAPVGRMAKPEEMASAVVWLCSDGASYVTGHTLVVDGAYVAR
ncbi:MAG TPA: SDR family oxidoreductase [Candidatus Angelobacter sp.]|nr:SDR family oxidoreductase [Candidatus Angelobacter sp.]